MLNVRGSFEEKRISRADRSDRLNSSSIISSSPVVLAEDAHARGRRALDAHSRRTRTRSDQKIPLYSIMDLQRLLLALADDALPSHQHAAMKIASKPVVLTEVVAPGEFKVIFFAVKKTFVKQKHDSPRHCYKRTDTSVSVGTSCNNFPVKISC